MSSIRRPAGPGLLVMAYSVVSYAIFLAVTVYSIFFFASRGVPRTIDTGPRAGWPAALAIDLGLLSLFAVQHTVMARAGFKRRWTRVVPAAAERSTFVLATCAVLIALFALWHPIGGRVWALSGPAAWPLTAVYAAGWLLVVGSTFLISHADLFGLRQAWSRLCGRSYQPPAFTERGLYRRVRHPLMAGFLVVFWAAPVMTVGHLLFAAASTGYILTGIAFEEHDLRHQLGQAYRDYQARVPALVPWRLRGTVPVRRGSAPGPRWPGAARSGGTGRPRPAAGARPTRSR